MSSNVDENFLSGLTGGAPAPEIKEIFEQKLSQLWRFERTNPNAND